MVARMAAAISSAAVVAVGKVPGIWNKPWM
jgi:hypothetical protein